MDFAYARIMPTLPEGNTSNNRANIGRRLAPCKSRANNVTMTLDNVMVTLGYAIMQGKVG